MTANGGKDRLHLPDGGRVAVIGGGPAGSFFSYFLLTFAERLGRDIHVDIYEPRDFWAAGPAGCNMCGGIISESLVQNMAVEGIELPDNVVQRGIDSYVLHTDAGSCCIATPLEENRIAAVHRGGGPRTPRRSDWASFDAHLFKLAINKGANFYNARVKKLGWNGTKPEVRIGQEPPRTYDLLVGAIGVNSPELAIFEALGFQYRRPEIVRTYVTELALEPDAIQRKFGSSMHIFLLDLPRLGFAAMIPKGDYVTLCILGKKIDRKLIASFFAHPEVQDCFPSGWTPPADTCHCSPKMYFGGARKPFTDRIVLIGDSGVSRLYKDGIGAAYRTAKAAARVAVFEGISTEAFGGHYFRECRRINNDNNFGKLVFASVHVIKGWRSSAGAVLRVVDVEKARPARLRRMSTILWDTFTGSSPYKNIFGRSLHPALLMRLLFEHALGTSRAVSRNGIREAMRAARNSEIDRR